MSPSTPLAPRSLVHQLLVERAEPALDAEAFAAAAAHVYRQAEQQLVPLIGERGVNALADRSLVLIRREFPWLTAREGITPEVSPIGEALLDMEGQPPAVALSAGAALIATFCNLLETFVGAPLTTLLLGHALRGALTDEAVESSM
jgi:hypothetical protein